MDSHTTDDLVIKRKEPETKICAGTDDFVFKKGADNTNYSGWLPCGVDLMIILRLCQILDRNVLRFRSVCKRWAQVIEPYVFDFFLSGNAHTFEGFAEAVTRLLRRLQIEVSENGFCVCSMTEDNTRIVDGTFQFQMQMSAGVFRFSIPRCVFKSHFEKATQEQSLLMFKLRHEPTLNLCTLQNGMLIRKSGLNTDDFDCDMGGSVKPMSYDFIFHWNWRDFVACVSSFNVNPWGDGDLQVTVHRMFGMSPHLVGQYVCATLSGFSSKNFTHRISYFQVRADGEYSAVDVLPCAPSAREVVYLGKFNIEYILGFLRGPICRNLTISVGVRLPMCITLFSKKNYKVKCYIAPVVDDPENYD